MRIIVITSAVLLAGSLASAQVRPVAPSPRPAGTTGATTPSASGNATNAGGAAAADYRLVSGDKLRIEVYKDAQLSQSLQVRPDGKITMPLVGDIPAAGKTSMELRDSIAASLKEYITNPTVTVIVVETVPQTIHVMGEVKAPGPQPLTTQLSMLQALAAAGGFTDFANRKAIRVLRKTTNGGTTTLNFNYKDAVKTGAQPFYLQPGDIVIVQ